MIDISTNANRSCSSIASSLLVSVEQSGVRNCRSALPQPDHMDKLPAYLDQIPLPSHCLLVPTSIPGSRLWVPGAPSMLPWRPSHPLGCPTKNQPIRYRSYRETPSDRMTPKTSRGHYLQSTRWSSRPRPRWSAWQKRKWRRSWRSWSDAWRRFERTGERRGGEVGGAVGVGARVGQGGRPPSEAY